MVIDLNNVTVGDGLSTSFTLGDVRFGVTEDEPA